MDGELLVWSGQKRDSSVLASLTRRTWILDKDEALEQKGCVCVDEVVSKSSFNSFFPSAPRLWITITNFVDLRERTDTRQGPVSMHWASLLAASVLAPRAYAAQLRFSCSQLVVDRLDP